MTPTPETLFEEFFRFCLEHGGSLKNHREFSERGRELRLALVSSEQARQRAETAVAVARRMASLEPEAMRGLDFTELRNLWAELVIAVAALPPDTPTDEPEDCVTGSDHIPGPFE